MKQLPVTLGMACERHGLDCKLIVSLLNTAIAALETERQTMQKQPESQLIIGKKPRKGDPVDPHHIIGDVLKVYPATEKVFEKYYGASCFSCP